MSWDSDITNVCSKAIGDTQLHPTNIQWEDYNILKFDVNRRNTQVRYLHPTGLCEPNDGVEYTFVPTKSMLDNEKLLMELYKQIKTQDHEVKVYNEVYFTSKIEGANTTIARTSKIHDGADIDPNNYFSEKMILGCFNATKVMNSVAGKVNHKVLRLMWEALTDGACDNEDIRGVQYRVGHVQVGRHVGLNYTLLDDAMSNWIDYYNSSNLRNHPFIKASLLHYVFESIHPFCDGNGRAGRLLMNNYLIYHGFENIKAVSFSRSIDKDRSGYDSAFNRSDNVYTDCTPFIEYMLGRMLDAFADVLS